MKQSSPLFKASCSTHHLITFWLPLGCGSLTRQPEKHKRRNGFEQDCKPSAPLGKSELHIQTLKELGQYENILNCENKGCVKPATTSRKMYIPSLLSWYLIFFFFLVGVTCYTKVCVTSRDKERKKEALGALERELKWYV